MARVMIARLLTPAILLVSFGVTLGLTGPRAAPRDAPSASLVVPVSAALSPIGPTPAPPPNVVPTPLTSQEPQPVPAPDPEDETPVVVTQEDRDQESQGFLDARDRAAEHGARSH